MALRRLVLTPALVLALAQALPVLCAAQERKVPREGRAGGSAVSRQEMESFEVQLDRALDRVSVPHAGMLLGRSGSARGYRLPGYGVVFVLTPRALPMGEKAFFVLRRRSPGQAFHVEVRPRPLRKRETDEEASEYEQLERQVLVLQREAEATRRAAEEEMDRIVADMRGRLVSAEGDEPMEPPPVAPIEGTAPAPPSVPVPATPPVPSVPAAPLPAPPPWKHWFGTEPSEDDRTPDRIVADVRAALIETLEAGDRRVPGLGADEYVTMAVDFVPGGLFASRARPERTLIVRARGRDLEARARGALTPEELRRRVEVVEY